MKTLGAAYPCFSGSSEGETHAEPRPFDEPSGPEMTFILRVSRRTYSSLSSILLIVGSAGSAARSSTTVRPSTG